MAPLYVDIYDEDDRNLLKSKWYLGLSAVCNTCIHHEIRHFTCKLMLVL